MKLDLRECVVSITPHVGVSPTLNTGRSSEVWIGLILSKYPELAAFVNKILAITLLSCDLIHSTYSVLQIQAVKQSDKLKLEAFLRYFKRYRLRQVTPIELSVFDLENETN